MKLTERLLNAAKSLWDAYNAHPFVLGIQNGTLAREKFRYYIIQDALYLRDYAKVFAVGVAKARKIETANLFAKYISVMNGELDVHKGYLARLGVSEEELSKTAPELDNLSYTSYMLRVAYEEGETEILAAILSCAYSYERIARNIVSINPHAAEHAFYGDWVKSYISEGYSAENRILLDTLDALSEDCSEEQLRHLTDIFLTCSRYELAFWEMSWRSRA